MTMVNEPYLEACRSITYHVIVLDTQQTLSLHSGDIEEDDYFFGEAAMINLYYADGMDQYEGQHITFNIDPAHTC